MLLQRRPFGDGADVPWAEPMAMSWPADEENNRTVGAVEAEVKPCNLQQERSFGLRATTLTLPGKRLTLVG